MWASSCWEYWDTWVDRKGQEFYQITLGGSAKEDAAIGEIVGPSFSENDLIDAIEKSSIPIRNIKGIKVTIFVCFSKNWNKRI